MVQTTNVVLCWKVIDACTTSNDVWVKSRLVLNVMLEPKIHLYIVAISPPWDRHWRGNDIMSNSLGANSTVYASSPWALSHVSVTKKEVNAIIFYKRWHFTMFTSHIIVLHWLCIKWSNNEWMHILLLSFYTSTWMMTAWKIIANV